MYIYIYIYTFAPSFAESKDAVTSVTAPSFAACFSKHSIQVHINVYEHKVHINMICINSKYISIQVHINVQCRSGR